MPGIPHPRDVGRGWRVLPNEEAPGGPPPRPVVVSPASLAIGAAPASSSAMLAHHVPPPPRPPIPPPLVALPLLPHRAPYQGDSASGWHSSLPSAPPSPLPPPAVPPVHTLRPRPPPRSDENDAVLFHLLGPWQVVTVDSYRECGWDAVDCALSVLFDWGTCAGDLVVRRRCVLLQIAAFWMPAGTTRTHASS